MATVKQLEAKLKKLSKQIKAKEKNIKDHRGNDIVQTAENWIADKLKAKVTEKIQNTYKLADNTERKGVLLKLDNGKVFQVGQSRFWKVN